MTIAYYTTDTGELAPYPNMTSDDLRDFEDWAAEQDANTERWFRNILYVSVGLIIILVVVLSGSEL